LNIELKNIGLTFDSKRVLDQLSWIFSKGNFYLLKGPSGCGKSSLLRLLSSLSDPHEGEVIFDKSQSILELRRSIHYLTQLPLMFPGTVEENLLKPFSFPPYLEESPSIEKCQKIIDELFPEGLDLSVKAEKLSQGQKQRVALCRTLLINPQVLLCDEPAASLDAESRKIVDKAIGRFFHSSADKMVVYVSHHDEIHVGCDYQILQLINNKLEKKL
jgi:putative ABC transport system ATP-binding protein